MQQVYKLIIKNDRYKQVAGFQLAFLTLMTFCFIAASYFEDKITGFIWPGLLTISIFFMLNKSDFRRFKFFRVLNFKESGFLWAIAGCIFLLTWWVALLVFAVAILQAFVKEYYELHVSDKSIAMLTYPQKNMEWTALQNMVIKDGLLTIDYKNNKIMQAEIIPALSNIGDEAEFNDFCRLQLKAHSQS